MRLHRSIILTLAVLVLVPALASAQQGIAGEVSDNTGGVLPGVTVEASGVDTLGAPISGAARVAISDGQGQYALANLPIGVYTVTFTLPGFSTLVR